jgi:hypothetical protein
MAKKSAKKLAKPSKTLLKRWHEETAKIVDQEGVKINAAENSRVIKCSFNALARMISELQITELEAVELLVSELRDACECK